MNIGRLALQSIEDVAKAVNHSVDDLVQLARNKTDFYGSFKIKKRTGGDREINPPKGLLLEVQHSIKKHLEDHLVWTRSVHGGVKNRDVLSNAKPHVKREMVANLDIASFFPSTTSTHVREALVRAGCGSEAADFIAELTMRNNALPQGSPTSTILGNLVLEPMDTDFMKFCRRHDLVYTRFIDDLTISGKKSLTTLKGVFLGFIIKAGFTASPEKIRFTPRHQRQEVTGLVVNDVIRPARSYIVKLKHDLRECWPQNLGPHKMATTLEMDVRGLFNSLWGRIRFVNRYDRRIGNTLRGYMAAIQWPSPLITHHHRPVKISST